MIEILVVFALIAIVGAFALFVSMDTYRGSSFRSDRDLLISTLERARAQAMSNICAGSSCADGSAHGVHIESDKYVLFQGTAYVASDPINAPFASTPFITKTGLTDVIFSQLTGNPISGGTITLSDQAGHSSKITITSVGRICSDDPSC